MELAVSIEKYKTLLEDKLDELKIPSTPADLYDPIRYILSLGGKRMRPVLLLMATEMFDGDIDEAINQALAVEVFHNFTLVHDDIMDKAPVRRGYPTVHTKWNENVGILSGDVMFVLAYKLISTNRTPKLHKILDVFNTTAIEVCEGQQLDMDYETQENVSIEDYIEMIRLKTAVLLGGTLKIGAVIAETSEENAHNIYEFGHKLGIAFQLQDDLLDVFGNPEKFGKQVGGDILTNKKTYLYLKAYELANEETKRELDHAFNLSDFRKVKAVTEIYEQLEVKKLTEDLMDAYYHEAMGHMSKVDISDEKKAPLVEIADKLMIRES